MSLDQYLQFTARSLEELRDAQRDQAEFGARVSAALNAVADGEGIEVSEEDFEREFQFIADQYGLTVDQVKGFFGEDVKENMGREIRQKKAVAFILENADITTTEE